MSTGVGLVIGLAGSSLAIVLACGFFSDGSPIEARGRWEVPALGLCLGLNVAGWIFALVATS